jgi:hypothetical protein
MDMPTERESYYSLGYAPHLRWDHRDPDTGKLRPGIYSRLNEAWNRLGTRLLERAVMDYAAWLALGRLSGGLERAFRRRVRRYGQMIGDDIGAEQYILGEAQRYIEGIPTELRYAFSSASEGDD